MAKQQIKIVSNFDPNNAVIRENFHKLKEGIFNAILQQEIPPEHQQRAVNQLIKEGYIKAN